VLIFIGETGRDEQQNVLHVGKLSDDFHSTEIAVFVLV
jgi:hypothetical protein